MLKTLKGIVVGLFMFNGLSSAMAEQSINSVPHVQQLAQQVEAKLYGTDPLLRYHAYKAKMWLSYAKSEISVQGLSRAGQEALQQAQILVDGFNQPAQLSLTTPILSIFLLYSILYLMSIFFARIYKKTDSGKNNFLLY